MTLVTSTFQAWAEIGVKSPTGAVLVSPATPILDASGVITTTEDAQIDLVDGVMSREFEPTPDGLAVQVAVVVPGFPQGPYWVQIPDQVEISVVDLLQNHQVPGDLVVPFPTGSTALELIAQVQTTADAAQATADTAHTVATGAASDASDAKSTAQGAAQTASSAAETAGDVASTVNDGRLSEDQLSTTFVAPDELTSAVAPKLDKIEAASTYTRAQNAPIIATIGDSITAYNGSYLNDYARLGPGLAGDRLIDWAVFATGGYTLNDILVNHLPSVLAMNPAPRACLIAGGTNDLATGYSLSAMQATHQQIIDALVAKNIEPIYWCPPPRSSDVANATANRNTAEWSAYLRSKAMTEGRRILDANKLLSDSTGTYAAAYIPAQQGSPGDGIHPNIAGHLVLAREYAKIIRSLCPIVQAPFLASPLGSEVTAGMGLFLTDTNADGYADGTSSVSAGTTGSVVASAPTGKWQRKAILAGATSPGSIRIDTSGLIAGHEYDFAVVVNASLVGPGATVTAGIVSTWRTSSATVGGVNPKSGYGGAHNAGGLCLLDTTDFVYIYMRVVAPATATAMRTDLAFTGTAVADGWAQIAQYTIRDRTALGL